MQGGKPSTNTKSWLRALLDSLLMGLRTGIYTLAILLIRGVLFVVASAVVISVVVFSLSYIIFTDRNPIPDQAHNTAIDIAAIP